MRKKTHAKWFSLYCEFFDTGARFNTANVLSTGLCLDPIRRLRALSISPSGAREFFYIPSRIYVKK
jgi:hypothetical protein